MLLDQTYPCAITDGDRLHVELGFYHAKFHTVQAGAGRTCVELTTVQLRDLAERAAEMADRIDRQVAHAEAVRKAAQ